MARAINITGAGGVRVHASEKGLGVIADITPPGYVGAFSVSVAGGAAVRVGIGTVEQLVPRLRGVSIDGLDDRGEMVDVPDLDCSREGPNDELRSWVFLRVKVSLESGEMVGDKDAAVIVHGNNLEARYRRGFSLDDGEGFGYLPLAMLMWQDEATLKRVIRNVYFPQRHTFKAGTKAGERGVHFFWPTA